nr:hypothetical protein [Tanacetum cinerariifolium]
MVESDKPKKKNLQEQIDVQVVREIEEEMAREDQRLNEQIARDVHPTASTKTIPTTTPTEIPILRQYFRRATRIAQSKALPTAADGPASLLRDNSQGEAFLTVSGLEAGHDRENIVKTFALPHDSTPRVTSFDADEGTKDKGKEKMVELVKPKKKNLQEQIDVQVVREIEEEMAREDQRSHAGWKTKHFRGMTLGNQREVHLSMEAN